MGLITDILRTTPRKKLAQPILKVNPHALKSKSDKELFQDFIEVSAMVKAKRPLTRADKKRYQRAVRTLSDRGLMTKVTHEEW